MDIAAQKLNQEFHKRCTRNRRYSVRAFAKSLGISHTLLSLVMNGKRKPSAKLLAKVQGALPASNETISPLKITGATAELNATDFSQIATWVHYGLLSYFSLPRASQEFGDMAKKFSTSTLQIKSAISDLDQCGLIEKVKGRWQQVSEPIRVNNTAPLAVTTQFIREFILKAQEALDYGNFSQRDMRVMTFAMNERDLNYAREKIAKFRRELSEDLESRSIPNMVVALNTNLFPLTEE